MRTSAQRDESADRPDDIRIQSFSVSYNYPVVFTQDAFAPDNRCLVDALTRREAAKRHRLVMFVDDGVLAVNPELPGRIARYADAHADRIEMLGPIVPIAGGERCKNDPALVSSLLSVLSERAVDRHSYAVAIGGGAVLDAVGYAAAIFHRGVRHIRFPTTVLAQCDSGVGVKNAVNAHGLKNLIGTFAPPWAIINDRMFIDTLPPRDRRAGMAEAVKVALIRDREFFLWLEQNASPLAQFSPAHLDGLIKRSAELHMRQIALGGDPFEAGSARPLDFGHWSAHRLEFLTQHAVNHGEAVAIGIALDVRYSVMSGWLTERDGERIACLLERLGFVLWHEALRQVDVDGRLAVQQGLVDFREHLGGDLTVTMLAAIGRGFEVHDMDGDRIGQSIDWLARRAAR